MSSAPPKNSRSAPSSTSPLRGGSCRPAFGELAENVVGPHDGILHVRSGFAVEVQGLFEVEGDDRVAREPEQEIAEGAHRDDAGDACRRPSRQAPRCRACTSVSALAWSCVQKVIGLDPEPLASGDLDVGAFLILFRELVSELLAASRAESHHFIREVDRIPGLLFVSESLEPLQHDMLQIRLAAVDHVVDAGSARRTAAASTPESLESPSSRACPFWQASKGR